MAGGATATVLKFDYYRNLSDGRTLWFRCYKCVILHAIHFKYLPSPASWTLLLYAKRRGRESANIFFTRAASDKTYIWHCPCGKKLRLTGSGKTIYSTMSKDLNRISSVLKLALRITSLGKDLWKSVLQNYLSFYGNQKLSRCTCGWNLSSAGFIRSKCVKIRWLTFKSNMSPYKSTQWLSTWRNWRKLYRLRYMKAS